MGGLGSVSLAVDRASQQWPVAVEVRSSQPVLACLGSQYAGWNLSSGKYFAMGSGPARALARVEPLFRTLGYEEQADGGGAGARDRRTAAGRGGRQGRPGDRVAGRPASPSSMRRPRAWPAAVQIVARVLEVALHKANDLGFPLDRHRRRRRLRRRCRAPHPDFLTAMGRTNDAIIYGGLVPAVRRGPGRGRQVACRKAAEPRLARLRQAVRRDLQGASAAISTPSIRCCSARPR